MSLNTGQNEIIEDQFHTTPYMRGFDRLDTDTMGEPSIDLATRTFKWSVKSGQSYCHFWVSGTHFKKIDTQSVVWADETGTYYFYFDADGVLQSIAHADLSAEIFLKSAICGLVYYNKEAGTAWLAEDEAHGIMMDANTHLRLHLVDGFKYSRGGEIDGLADGSDEYGSISSAAHFDEDIPILSVESVEHRFMYRSGAVGGWVLSDPSDKIAYIGTTYAQYNEEVGGVWQLTESTTSTDYIIYYFLKTNFNEDSGAGLVKIVGQQAYASRSLARKALLNELHTIKLEGLPSAEAEFQFAYIAKRSGELEDDGYGNAYIDLRGVNINSLSD